jgi:hypothetical protein
MGLVTALAVSIGLLGGIATYLFLSDPLMLGLQIWAAFIGWASFYHCGGKGEGFVSSVLANLWGVVWGALTLLAFSQLPLGEALSPPVWAGICVAVGVGLMILGSNISIFSAIPATVYGYAATVALALLTTSGVGNLAMPTMENPAVIIAISMVVGAIFGIVSEKLAGALASS